MHTTAVGKNYGQQQPRRGGRHDSGAQLPTPSSSPDRFVDCAAASPGAAVTEWMEIWDYAGHVTFRGFIAEKDDQRAMFVFFDSSVIGKDLKQGYV